jgi:hypothetical protein
MNIDSRPIDLMITKSYNKGMKVLNINEELMLRRLRKELAYDISVLKLQNTPLWTKENELSILAMANASNVVLELLREYIQVRSEATPIAEMIACIVRTATQGLSAINTQDPVLAKKLALLMIEDITKQIKE